jgi:GTP-binding protein EngB required for normal cell division
MESTLNEFKKHQTNELQILSKLKDFLEFGENLGVEIDNTVKTKLLNAINEISTEKLRIALIGGFSEGKTSIAAAWLEKLDKSSMKISHQESSDEVKIYNVGNDIELVDTPGLFGFKEKVDNDTKSIEKYKDITRKYISEAHLILYVMNSVNPIKESHKDDLNWLFRTLNLLPRTIFVLSKFDDVADVEDEQSYSNEYNIKRDNVIVRLKDLINLEKQEINDLSVIAVAANPFDMGMEHWLKDIEIFKKLSHIYLLQNATTKKIHDNGGANILVSETKKSIIQDILYKQLPISENINEKISQEVDKLSEINRIINRKIYSLEPEINDAKIALRNFIIGYFSDLILQVKGTSLETFNRFYEREIASEGIIINTKIQNEFDKQIGSVNFELQKIETDFNSEIDSFNKTVKDYGKQGLSYLSKSKIINKDTILASRDLLITGTKTLGLDIGKYLKFKPWGATKLANGANAALAFIGLAIELWDSYEQRQKEIEFQRAVEKMVIDFEKQRSEILILINGENFISDFFPTYIKLQSESQQINKDIASMEETRQQFSKWLEMGEIIDVEFEDIKKIN